MYTYLFINLISVVIPFVAGFDKRLNFQREWKFLFPSLFITLAFFILWDVTFTYIGVWGFNERYLTGIKILNLPVEEWLFFIAIPYACVFTYQTLQFIFRKDYFGNAAKIISWVLIVILLLLAAIYYKRIYTSVTFSLTAIFLLIHAFIIKSNYLGKFYFAFLFIFLPFLIVNGVLTGSIIDEPVVWYNNEENLGIRIFTIPVEDSVYGFLLILMNVTFYEWFKMKSKNRISGFNVKI